MCADPYRTLYLGTTCIEYFDKCRACTSEFRTDPNRGEGRCTPTPDNQNGQCSPSAGCQLLGASQCTPFVERCRGGCSIIRRADCISRHDFHSATCRRTFEACDGCTAQLRETGTRCDRTDDYTSSACENYYTLCRGCNAQLRTIGNQCYNNNDFTSAGCVDYFARCQGSFDLSLPPAPPPAVPPPRIPSTAVVCARFTGDSTGQRRSCCEHYDAQTASSSIAAESGECVLTSVNVCKQASRFNVHQDTCVSSGLRPSRPFVPPENGPPAPPAAPPPPAAVPNCPGYIQLGNQVGEIRFAPGMVSAFGWYKDLFGERKLAVARCNPFGSNKEACKLEFHGHAGRETATSWYRKRRLQLTKEVPPAKAPAPGATGRLNEQSAGTNRRPRHRRRSRSASTLTSDRRNPTGVNPYTQKSALRIPTGIASLMSDDGIGASSGTSYFTAIFIGATPNEKERTIKNRGDPEDRVHIFRQPIVESRKAKTQDNIHLYWLGRALISPREIFQKNRALRRGTKTRQRRPRLRRQSSFRGLRGGRRLDADDAVDDLPLKVLHGGAQGSWSQIDALQNPQAYSRRQLAKLDFNRSDVEEGRALSEDYDPAEDANCFTAEIADLVEPRRYQLARVPIGTIVIIAPWLTISGEIRLYITLSAALDGSVCVDDRKITLRLLPRVTLNVHLAMSVTVWGLGRATITVECDVLGLEMRPKLGFIMKNGFDVGFNMDVALYPLTIRMKIGVEFFYLIFCMGFPCGFLWIPVFEFPIFEYSAPEIVMPLIPMISTFDTGDNTPPTVGTVELVQLGNNTARVTWSGFEDPESEIDDVLVRIAARRDTEVVLDRAYWELTYVLPPDRGACAYRST
jgi:hypothetical protein